MKNLTDTDLSAWYNADIHDKYKLALLIASKDGLRCKEIVNLQIRDLEFEKNLYRLKWQKNGIINGSAYMCVTCKLAIKNYIKKHKYWIKRKGNYLIFSRRQNRMNPHSLTSFFWRNGKRLGIRRIYMTSTNGNQYAENTFHAARHKSTKEFAIALKKAGKDNALDCLMQHGRWKTPAMALHYMDHLQDDLIQLNGKLREEVM